MTQTMTPEFQAWLDSLKKEEQKLREYHKKNNMYVSEEKIKFMARENVGNPPSSGWRD